MVARAKGACAVIAFVAGFGAPALGRAEERAAPPPAQAAPTPTSTPKPSTRAASAPPASLPKAPSRSEPAPKAQSTDRGAHQTNVVATEETDEGVKTYEFGAVEVEGRLRSPQLIYFMRRVRAAFEAGDLGHRSFLKELSDTRRHPAFK